MDIQALKIIDEGTAGYRTPWKPGTVDVFTKWKRYIFLTPKMPRVAWRAAVACLILGPSGKSSDLVRVDSVLPGSVATARQAARQYRIGSLGRPGAPTRSARRPGDPPAHAAAGLELVDHLPLGDPRRQVAGWGRRRGQVLVLDSVTGDAWFFRCEYGGASRKALKAKVAVAWALNSGPAVEFRGRYPAWAVTARQWTAEERAAIASARVRGGLWRARRRKDGQAAAAVARVTAERAGRAEVSAAARVVTRRAVALKRAEVSAARWPGAERAEAVRVRRVWLDAAWVDYLGAYKTWAARLGGSGRPLARPAGSRGDVGAIPRPAWVIEPWE